MEDVSRIVGARYRFGRDALQLLADIANNYIYAVYKNMAQGDDSDEEERLFNSINELTTGAIKEEIFDEFEDVESGAYFGLEKSYDHAPHLSDESRLYLMYSAETFIELVIKMTVKAMSHTMRQSVSVNDIVKTIEENDEIAYTYSKIRK